MPTSPSTPSLTEASKTKSILTLSSADGGSLDKEELVKKKPEKKGKSDSSSVSTEGNPHNSRITLEKERSK